MELDNTRITIRERGLLDTMDLSLHVLRRFVQPIFWLTLAAVIPLGLFNYWLLGWMVNTQTFDYLGYQDHDWGPGFADRIYYMLPWRYMFDMALLIFIEAPLASIFVTAYLGEAVFMQKPTYRQVFQTVLKHSPGLILCQLLIRGILPAWLLLCMMSTYNDNAGIEVFLWLLAMYTALFRSLRPYINEIILLEKNPIRARGPNAITINKRSSHLHSSSSGDLFGRWLASAMLATSLFGVILIALYLGVGVLIGNYEFSWYFVALVYPAAFWAVVAYYSVVRYLDYLDLRIRYEGWEVELLMRAEAAKMAGKVVSRKHKSEIRMSKFETQLMENISVLNLNSQIFILQSSIGNSRMRPFLSHFVLLLAGIFLLAPAAAIAQNGTEDSAIKDARESLGGGGAFPWYDREKDASRPLNLQRVEDDSENRKSTATATPTAPTTTATPPNLSWLGRMLQVMGIAVLVALLVLAVVLITRAFMNSEVTETTGSKVVETSQDVDRVEHLPFQLRKPTGDFLSEARRLYEAGDYSQAILYLYSHFLVQLDRQQVIRLAKGKTNRQYLRETRSRPVLFPILEITMISFEDVFFGHHKISREQFEASWNRLSEFEAELSRVERAAA